MLRHMRSSIYFVKNVFFQFKQARQYWLTSHEVNWVRQDILIIVSIYIRLTQYKKKSCNVVMLKPSSTFWFKLKQKLKPSQTTKRSIFGHLSSRTRTRNSKIKISSDHLKETTKNYKILDL